MTQTLDVKRYALNLLSRREFGFHELCKKLKSNFGCIDTSEIECIVQELQDNNLQSDERYAEAMVRSKSMRYGPVKIAMELRAKGISNTVVDTLLSSFSDDYWKNLAMEVRAKRFGYNLPEDYSSQAKQKRFLLYRGFTSQQAVVAIQAREE